MFSKNKPYYNFDINANDPESMDTLTSDAITTTAENRIDITAGLVNLRIGSVSEATSGAIKLNASGLQAHSTGLFCTNVESEELNKGINKLIFNTSTNEIQRSSTLQCGLKVSHEGDDRINGIVIRDGTASGNIIFNDGSLGLSDGTHSIGAVNLTTNTIHCTLTFKASSASYAEDPVGASETLFVSDLTLSSSSALGGTGTAVFTGIQHGATYNLEFALQT
jgi:hypothetical protein